MPWHVEVKDGIPTGARFYVPAEPYQEAKAEDFDGWTELGFVDASGVR
jgi:hypothetical protein